MPRISVVLAGALLPLAAVGALSGCSSAKDGGGAKATASRTDPAAGTKAPAPGTPTASAGGGSSDAGGNHGRIDYTGTARGGFDVTTSVGCAVVNGKLVAVTVPDAGDASGSTVPSFVANIASQGMATLVTPDRKTFVKLGADGLSAAQDNGTWTVAVHGTELGAADASGGSVTIDGHLVCTKINGS